jgi:hypothetical protein
LPSLYFTSERDDGRTQPFHAISNEDEKKALWSSWIVRSIRNSSCVGQSRVGLGRLESRDRTAEEVEYRFKERPENILKMDRLRIIENSRKRTSTASSRPTNMSTRHSASLPSLKPSLMALLLLSQTVLSQQVLDPGALPSCALSCGLLTDAQKVCVPPAAPATDQATYKSCFCASDFLAGNLKQGKVDGLCQPECNAADMGRVLEWFNGFCGAPATGAVPAPIAPVVGTPTVTSNAGGPKVTLGTTDNRKSNGKALAAPVRKSW